jgi:hypothetical protein
MTPLPTTMKRTSQRNNEKGRAKDTDNNNEKGHAKDTINGNDAGDDANTNNMTYTGRGPNANAGDGDTVNDAKGLNKIYFSLRF